MKVADFDALCNREWEKKSRGGRGDVVSLILTETSYEELVRDLLLNPRTVGILRDTGNTAHMPPANMPLVNPVTRSVVKVRAKPDRTRESARVRVPGGYRQTWWRAR